jgi:hypothetical protein
MGTNAAINTTDLTGWEGAASRKIHESEDLPEKLVKTALGIKAVFKPSCG